jgi:ABC-type sugar transport system ATPase subunit
MEALEFKNVTKHFGGVKALTDISFGIPEGVICSIVGENGAGKSTLMKIISGALEPNEGELYISGIQVKEFSPIVAQKNGVGIVYQELSLAPNMYVYENIFLGRPVMKGIKYDHKLMIQRSREILQKLDINIDPMERVGNLSAAHQQLVEIARVLQNEPKILILDEPTSSLSDKDSKRLLEILRQIKSNHCTILYISHRLNEVKEISDSIVVMRDGCFVGQYDAADLDNNHMVKLMIGENVELKEKIKKDFSNAYSILEAVDVSIPHTVHNVSFKLHKGEILGFAGLIGAGRSELMRGIFGLDKLSSGKIILEGTSLRQPKPWNIIGGKAKTCFISENRKTEGLIFGKSIKENIVLTYRTNGYRGSLIRTKSEAKIANRYKDKLSIKCSNIDQNVEDLSGGNQQKVVIAKSLAVDPDVIILDEPTRGIDIGAKTEIYKIIMDLAQEGKSIILVSSEFEELKQLCDRVVVMSAGTVIAELNGDEICESNMLKNAIPS